MREDKQSFFDFIPVEYKSSVYLCTHTDRVELLRQKYPLNVVDIWVTDGIAQVRQKCLETFKDEEKILMVDDNSILYKLNEVGKFRHMESSEFGAFLVEMEKMLDSYFQVGMVDGWIRGFYKDKEKLENFRIFSIMWINVKQCIENDIRFDGLYLKNKAIHLGEDFYFTLSWLTKGFKNCLMTKYSFNHPHWKKWGNSTSRTLEMERISYEMLLEAFPWLLTYDIKYNNSWNVWEDENGKCRYKVMFKWKKAYTQWLSNSSK